MADGPVPIVRRPRMKPTLVARMSSVSVTVCMPPSRWRSVVPSMFWGGRAPVPLSQRVPFATVTPSPGTTSPVTYFFPASGTRRV